MGRPPVDVVTPFAGTDDELARVRATLAGLALADGDSVTVADNRPGAAGAAAGVRVVPAPRVRSSYHARNVGAAAGSADWIVFLDADVLPEPDLLERYFDPEPGARTAVLAGAIVDEPPPDGAPFALRYSAARGTLDHRNTLRGRWAYAQTASCAVRRSAFEAVGGFRDDIRSGGDADLCFRLRAAGWELESRERAVVVHRNRDTLRRLLRQRMRHGSGAGWLDRAYPGSAPGRGSWPGLVKWTLQSSAASAARYARGEREEARLAMADLGTQWAMELGRLIPNEVRR
ncbi:MAG TPA: glycosyltransferase [Thermoleophilaceae bacterium]